MHNGFANQILRTILVNASPWMQVYNLCMYGGHLGKVSVGV